MRKYLHIMISEKFMPPYINFIREHFEYSEHTFIYVTSEKYQFGLTPSHGVRFIHTDKDFILLSALLKSAEKIIVHGLWRDKINHLLLTVPEVLHKTYWVMWGADFYSPESKNQQHHKVIQSIGFLVSYSKGDINLVRRWYGAKGIAVDCFAYPSNLYQPSKPIKKRRTNKNILIGNSGAINNNHLLLLKRLVKYEDSIGNIYVPLSYANRAHPEYIANVIDVGKKLFADKFKPLLDFLPFESYLELLKEMDLALFEHDRQQGMGTIISLLSNGCKVYIRPTVTTWDTLERFNLPVFDINKLDETFSETVNTENTVANLKQHFSKTMLVRQWQTIFSE